MPRKSSKITAIPVDEPVAEEKTDAQEMTEVIAQVAEETAPPEETPVKKRATRTPKVKKDTITTVWESKTDDDGKPSTKDEQQGSTSSDEQPAKVGEQAPPSGSSPATSAPSITRDKGDKVACEHCGKLVSAKTMKYNHRYSCKAYPNNEPVKEKVELSEEMLKEALRQRLAHAREAKAKLRQERMQKLVADAF